MAVLGEKLYAIGGKASPDQRLSSVECLDLSFKSQVEFVASPCFLGSQCVTFHRLEFGFHRPTKLVFQSVEGQLVLDCEVFGDVRFHGVDSLGDRLLTKPTFATQIGPQALLLTEPGAGAHGFVKGRSIGGSEL